MEVEEAPPAKRPRVEEENWAASKNNCAPKVGRELYLDKKTADVYFICGTESESERIPAHKYVLSKSSPVFAAMFYGPNAEEGDKKLIPTPPEAFKDFLQFCYLDEVALHPDNITEVMKLTHEYQMFESLKFCGNCWAMNLSIDEVCVAFDWAIHLEMDEFKEFCGRKISAHPKLVFETDGFKSCKHTVLDHILQLDTLLCDEKFVLQACMDWARCACEQDGLDGKEIINLRKYLKESLYKIRFKSMTPNEFRDHMDSKGGLFTDVRDYEDVIRLISGSSDLRTGHFNPNPRSSLIPWKENFNIECKLGSIEKFEKKQISSETIGAVLTSNRSILLGGFYCSQLILNNTYQDENESTVIIKEQLNENNINPKIIHTGKIKLLDRTESYFELVNNPIVIRPEFKYTIELSISTQFGNYYYHKFKFDQEIKLDKETTLKVTASGVHFIIRSFKFNLL